MNTSHQSGYWLSIATDVPESPDTLALLDAGSGTDPSIWAPVVDSLASMSCLILVGQYRAGTDLQEAASAIVSGIQQALSDHTGLRSQILVGSQRGTHTLQLAIHQQPNVATHLVLIDPEPLALIPDNRAHRSNRSLQEPLPVPTTIILHGTSPADSSDEARRVAQEREIRGFPDRREILAGRSRTCILSERPDVVIEALKSLQGTQFHPAQNLDT